MADWAKIALKTGLIAGVMAAIWAVFTQIQIPYIGVTDWFWRLRFGLGFLKYWVPGFDIVWGVTLTLLGIYLALWTFRLGSIAIRWLFKVNE